MRLHLSWGASYVESSAAHWTCEQTQRFMSTDNKCIFIQEICHILLMRDTKSMVCPSRATETVDLVSLRHTWALCLVSMWQLLSQRVKSLLQTICVRVHMWGFNSRQFHCFSWNLYLLCVCSLCFSLWLMLRSMLLYWSTQTLAYFCNLFLGYCKHMNYTPNSLFLCIWVIKKKNIYIYIRFTFLWHNFFFVFT